MRSEDVCRTVTAVLFLLLGVSPPVQAYDLHTKALPKIIECATPAGSPVTLVENGALKFGKAPSVGLKDSRTLPNSACFAAVDFCERFRGAPFDVFCKSVVKLCKRHQRCFLVK